MMVRWVVTSTGGAISTRQKFNNDTGANYAWQQATGFTTTSNQVSQSIIALTASGAAGTRHGQLTVSNITAQRKLFTGFEFDDNNAGPASSVNIIEAFGKWDNTAAQITRFDLTNVGAGDFAIGSSVVVLGHD